MEQKAFQNYFTFHCAISDKGVFVNHNVDLDLDGAQQKPFNAQTGKISTYTSDLVHLDVMETEG